MERVLGVLYCWILYFGRMLFCGAALADWFTAASALFDAKMESMCFGVAPVMAGRLDLRMKDKS